MGFFSCRWEETESKLATGENKNVISVRLADSDIHRVLVSLASKERIHVRFPYPHFVLVLDL